MNHTDDTNGENVDGLRRRLLQGAGVGGVAGLAGCLGSLPGFGDDDDDDDDETESATFAVTGLEPADATVEIGETVDVSATVENTGDAEGTQTIEYRVDGESIESTDVTLEPGEDETVEFADAGTDDLDEGSYDHGVYADDDEATGSLTVEDPTLEVLYLGESDADIHSPPGMYATLAPYMRERGIEVVYTERLADLEEETLHEYDALMIYGDLSGLSGAQESSLISFVEDGNGFVGVHSASASFTDSETYIGLLGGQFDEHGDGEMTTDRIVPDHPVFEGADEIETWEETYRHVNLADDIEVLAYGEGADFGEDEDAPFTWVREQGDGRVFYTAWGHDDNAWQESGFKQLIENGLRWSSGNEETIEEHPTLDSLEYTDGQVPYYGPDEPPEEVRGDGEVPTGSYENANDVWVAIQDALDVEASAARAITPAGFEVEPYVSEEQFPDGVEGQIMDMAFDESGRCWIAVSQDYPNDAATDGEDGNDSIVICEDTDGDGVADEFSVFKEGLSIPLSLVAYEDGVIVSEIDEFVLDDDGDNTGANVGRIVYLGDEDGDGVADVEETLFDGFATGDTHAGPNQLVYGIDNWIWGQVGYDGFDGTVGGESHSFASAVFRFRPDGSELEFVASMNGNLAGLDFTEEGLVFASAATTGNPSNYVAIPNRYYEMADSVSAQTLSNIAPTNRFLPSTDFIRQVDRQGGFTAATGHEVYTARTYPEKYWNQTAFIGDGTGHLVGTFYIEQDGAGYTTYNHTNLVSNSDEWFSPTYSRVGPDGQVWVVDFYNYIFQHNPTPSGYENGLGNSYVDENRDNEHGRVHRVTYGDADAQSQDLSEAGADELVDALTDDNMFWRQTAQRLLVERGETDVVSDLIDLVEDDSTDDIGLNPGAIHALWTLHGLDALEDDDALAAAEAALEHPSAGVRLNAVRVLPGTEATREAILDAELLEDDDGRVVMWTLLKLAETPPSDDAASAIGDVSSDDELIEDAADIALEQHE